MEKKKMREGSRRRQRELQWKEEEEGGRKRRWRWKCGRWNSVYSAEANEISSVIHVEKGETGEE